MPHTLGALIIQILCPHSLKPISLNILPSFFSDNSKFTLFFFSLSVSSSDSSSNSLSDSTYFDFLAVGFLAEDFLTTFIFLARTTLLAAGAPRFPILVTYASSFFSFPSSSLNLFGVLLVLPFHEHFHYMRISCGSWNGATVWNPCSKFRKKTASLQCEWAGAFGAWTGLGTFCYSLDIRGACCLPSYFPHEPLLIF